MKKIFLLAVLFGALAVTVEAQKQTLKEKDSPERCEHKVIVSSEDIQTFIYKVNNEVSSYCFLTTPYDDDRRFLTVSRIKEVKKNLSTAQTGAKLLYPFFDRLVNTLSNIHNK